MLGHLENDIYKRENWICVHVINVCCNINRYVWCDFIHWGFIFIKMSCTCQFFL